MKMIPAKHLVTILKNSYCYEENIAISISDLAPVFDEFGDEYFISETTREYELCTTNEDREKLIKSLV